MRVAIVDQSSDTIAGSQKEYLHQLLMQDKQEVHVLFCINERLELAMYEC